MRIIYLISGFTSLGIGVVGVVLPILPTTPFLLLTGFLFAKSSDKYRDWFESTKVYKKYLKDFSENRSMTFRHKWTLLVLTDLMMIVSLVSINILSLRVFIVLLIAAKHLYFKKFVQVKEK